jgi:nucleoid-associated protein YgaU
MDTLTHRTTASFPRRSEMSTLAVAPGYAAPRERAVRAARPARPAVRAAAAAPAAPVRLTRRGRLVVTLLFVLALTVLATVFGATSAATGEAGTPVPTRTVVVQEGDTLWAIAGEVAAPGDVREMVHRIQELNALPGSGLTLGQELAVPLG